MELSELNKKQKEVRVKHQRQVVNFLLGWIATEVESQHYIALSSPTGHEHSNEFVLNFKVTRAYFAYDTESMTDWEQPYLDEEIVDDQKGLPSNKTLVANIFIHGNMPYEDFFVNIFITMENGLLKYYDQKKTLISRTHAVRKIQTILDALIAHTS